MVTTKWATDREICKIQGHLSFVTNLFVKGICPGWGKVDFLKPVGVSKTFFFFF